MRSEEKTTIVSSFYLFLFLVLLSGLFLALEYLGNLSWLHKSAEKMANPVKQLISQSVRKLSFGDQQSNNFSPIILQAKVDYLLTKLAILDLEAKNLEKENEALKKQLGVNKSAEEKFLPAKNLQVLNGIMTIDKGQNDNLKIGDLIFSGEILAGRIIQVSLFSSRIALPTAPENKISAKVLPSQEKGILNGLADGRIILEEVLQKVDLKPDQIITTDGKDGLYPPDLPIGKIESVLKDDAAIYKKAQIKPLVDYTILDVVMIKI